MKRSYQTWTVAGYMRPVIEWDRAGVPLSAGYSEPVVVVFDPRGWEWHVTAEAGRITSLTIRGKRVDAAALRTVPVGYLTEVATAYIGEVERAHNEGFPLSAALESADVQPGGLRLSGDAPSAQAFAEEWAATPERVIRNGQRAMRREVLAQRHGVTVWTIDKWTRAARDAGHIPQATVGRHRDSESPGGGQPRENNTEPNEGESE